MFFRNAAIAVAALATAASAQTVQYFPNLGATGLDEAGGLIESRFRMDTTNWNLRLEDNGFPVSGEPSQLNTGNGAALYENQLFDVTMSHQFTSGGSEIVWSIDRGDSVVSGSVSMDVPGGFTPNTIKIFTNGSRGALDVENLQFDGFGIIADGFADLDVMPSGPTFRESVAFFGESFDLLSEEWTLSGQLNVGAFTRSNPSEGTKITVKLQRLVPAPSGAALLGIAGLVANRRRR